MASEDNTDSGPSVQFSWNFPLVRVVTGTLTSVGSSVNQRRPGLITENVAERITEDSDDDGTEEVIEDAGDDGPLNDIRDRLSDLSDRDTSDLGVNGDDSVVTFSGDVFVPLRTEVEVGSEVTWTNNSDTDITLVFEDEQELGLPSGETNSREFNKGGLVQFQTLDEPQDQLCGAILVGDDAPTPVLPCEAGVDRELFEDEQSESVEVSAPSSMSSAADEKEKSWK